MAIQTFNTQPARIAKFKGALIKQAIPVEVLGITGAQYEMPRNSSDTIVMGRYLPYGGVDNKWITNNNVDTFADAHKLQEGVTPSADTLTRTDVTMVLQEYGCLYSVTNRVVDMYEDDVPKEMIEHVGRRIGVLREIVRYGAIKGMSNLYYGGAGVSKATVNGTVTRPMLSKITKGLKANHADMVTSILKSSPDFGTTAVDAGYLVFASTDLQPAFEALPGYKEVAIYGQRKPVLPQEIGSVGEYRIILSPELAGVTGGGAAVGSTGMEGATNIDIYPMIVVAKDAWGQVALRGEKSLNVTYIKPGEKDKNDPMGQRGFIGASTYMAASMLNDGWAALAWVGTPKLV